MAANQINGKGNLKTYDAHVPVIKFTKLFINGEFVDSVNGRTFETIDPRNGQVTARVAEGDKEDVDLAVKAARQAFDHGPWPRMPGYQRGRIMSKFADLIEENIDELAALDAIDAGKLFSVGKALDIPHAATCLRYYAGAADKIHGEVLKMSRELHGYTLQEPIGVVGHIIPWNFPTTMFFMKVAPALAAGCTVVMKPAEQTPLSALFYAHLAKKAGVPDGVINVVTGFGSTAGAAISSHMDIDMVCFTGSSDVGRIVMQAAAMSNLKQVSLELGGKSPLIVFDDADLDAATDLAITGILYNKGEICVASSRVYVQEGIYEEFEKKLVAKAKAWLVGDPFDPNVRQGPQVDKKQFERILSYIEHGKREGATLLTGGERLGTEGYYIQPTIFTNVKEDNVIVKDEIFGPVMSLMKFKTVEEAIKRANDTKYGLAAGVVTKNIDLANTVSRSIRAGVIWINCYFAFDNDCPYGGYKMSGFGRDFGLDALHKYLQVKSVVTPIYNSPWLWKTPIYYVKATYDAHVPEIKFTKLFINGDFVDSVNGRTLETIDPRNGQVTARVAEGDREDVDLAVKAARQAFGPRMPGCQRGRIMAKFADSIEKNIEELAALDAIDVGKTFSIGKARDIPHAATCLRYYADAADKIHGEVLKMSRELHGYTLQEPIGLVMKPAEQTPRSALFYTHLAKEGTPIDLEKMLFNCRRHFSTM